MAHKGKQHPETQHLIMAALVEELRTTQEQQRERQVRRKRHFHIREQERQHTDLVGLVGELNTSQE